MKKRILSFCLIFAISLMSGMTTWAKANLEIGDYVQMGTYYGQPILWRCVSFEKISGYDDDNNPIIDSTDSVTTYQEGYLPLLWSDKVICYKPFDGDGKVTTGSHGRGQYTRQGNGGSNYWGDSNIHCWLNSDASAGNVVWTCGNPPDVSTILGDQYAYEDEAGFLTNFTQSERKSMKTVVQKALLDGYECCPHYDPETDEWVMKVNPDRYIYASRNYETAFSELVTDTMFLIDVMQIQNIYCNGSILGLNYYKRSPVTDKCAEQLGYVPSIDSYCTRNPAIGPFGAQSTRVCIISGSSTLGWGEGDASTAKGIRPAFFFDTNAATFASGSGTETDPYVLGEGKTEDITIGKAEYQGNSVNVTAAIAADLLSENDIVVIALYQGEKLKAVQPIPASTSVNHSFTNLSEANNYSVKVFCWDGFEDVQPRYKNAVMAVK